MDSFKGEYNVNKKKGGQKIIMFHFRVHTYPWDFQNLGQAQIFLSYVAQTIQIVSDPSVSVTSLTTTLKTPI